MLTLAKSGLALGLFLYLLIQSMVRYNHGTINFIIFWDVLMFYQICLSPQVKRWAMMTYKDGIDELPHELRNDLSLRILGNSEVSGKCLNLIELLRSAQSPCWNESFVNTSKKLLKNKLSPAVRYFTWKLELVSNILWVIVGFMLFKPEANILGH